MENKIKRLQNLHKSEKKNKRQLTEVSIFSNTPQCSSFLNNLLNKHWVVTSVGEAYCRHSMSHFLSVLLHLLKHFSILSSPTQTQQYGGSSTVYASQRQWTGRVEMKHEESRAQS